MCGRFILISTPGGIVAKFLLMDFSMYARYNISPSQYIDGIIFDSAEARRVQRRYSCLNDLDNYVA